VVVDAGVDVEEDDVMDVVLVAEEDEVLAEPASGG